MKKSSTINLITCIECRQKREPAKFRAVFCAECAERIEAEMSKPLVPATETPRAFRKLPTGIDL